MTGWLGTEYFISACLALFIVDRVGRRNLMMWGAAGMAISLAIIGGCLSHTTPDNKTGAYVATVFIFVYDTCFAIGWLGVAWVRHLIIDRFVELISWKLYPAEITSIRIRAETNGLSTSTNWLFNYAVVQLAPIMINSIAWKTYFVFFCFNISFVPLVGFHSLFVRA